ncbi:MAG: ComF family protein [Clostridia bacterium]|nr:ComF family protein [Clostridia bacterium]
MIGRLKEIVLDLLFPIRAKCLGCGDEQGCSEPFLCDACRKLMRPSNVRAAHDEWKEHGLESSLFVYYYGKPVSGMIKAFKFHGVTMLAEAMAGEMANLLELRNMTDYDMIVPVPLHPSRLYHRGYNQSELLAKEVSKLIGLDMRTDVLSRVRKTRQQSKLKRFERSSNTASAFRAETDLTGKRILLIDDVVTTGSTLCACAEALKAAGAADIRALTLAGSRSIRKGPAKVYRFRKK